VYRHEAKVFAYVVNSCCPVYYSLCHFAFVCQHLQELEQDLLEEETQLPVYFTLETPELMSVYDDISKSVGSDSAGSAAEGMFS